MHANAGAWPMIVSLGCEKLQPGRLLRTGDDIALKFSNRITWCGLQSEPGFAATVSAIMQAARKRLAILNHRRRVECPASELVVGSSAAGAMRSRE